MTNLESLLALAESGQKDAIADFLRAFLIGELFVPDRYQIQPLSDQPAYPGDFFHLLGVQAQERVIIPTFSAADMIASWCGNRLKYKCITGQELCKLAPQDWWIVLNPGSDLAKEFTPWEINLLKLGPESIPEVVADIAAEFEPENLQVRPLKDGEFQEIVVLLIKYAESNQMLKTLHLLIEESGSDQDKLLIGIESDEQSQDGQMHLKDELDRLVKPHLIGNLELKIFVYRSVESAMAGRLFAHFPPSFKAN